MKGKMNMPFCCPMMCPMMNKCMPYPMNNMEYPMENMQKPMNNMEYPMENMDKPVEEMTNPYNTYFHEDTKLNFKIKTVDINELMD